MKFIYAASFALAVTTLHVRQASATVDFQLSVQPRVHTLLSCQAWASAQRDPGTLKQWGRTKDGRSSVDIAILRLSLSCLGDEPPKIIFFGTSAGFNERFCSDNKADAICKNNGIDLERNALFGRRDLPLVSTSALPKRGLRSFERTSIGARSECRTVSSRQVTHVGETPVFAGHVECQASKCTPDQRVGAHWICPENGTPIGPWEYEFSPEGNRWRLMGDRVWMAF